ncbi:MAG: arabinan endo-1,5-alpha-L-arabinosidase [Christensenellaceae bacterium]|nr:arabinan endo-1,5-alpha-L-arabinosidase [Christensenellaceae bacterium]
MMAKYPLIYPKAPPAEPPMPQKHEEAEGLWGAHDPAIYRDPVSKDYFLFCTRQLVFRSGDMIHWERLGKFIEETPTEVFAWTGADGLWAPDIIKIGEEYRMYCSCSSFGSQRSAIYLAVADKPEGPYHYRGMVVKTNENSPVNAIDANPIVDVRTGKMYMVFGSFWGGIRLMPLDKKTGLAEDPSLEEDGRTSVSAMGKSIARRPDWTTTGIEGPYIRYNPETDYYYLFVSYCSLASDYNIQVGRSRDIEGPYIGFNGVEMTDEVDYHETTGLMLACGYRFENSQGWMAPGHNSVLMDDDGSWYMISHIRPYKVFGEVMSTMHLRRMLWNEEGWPMVSPEVYAGEPIQPIPAEELTGRYEWITLAPTLPQTVSCSAPLFLFEDGKMRLSGYVKGHWETFGENGLLVEIGGGHVVKGKVTTAWDAENNCPTIVYTGITNDGIAVWAKKIQD